MTAYNIPDFDFGSTANFINKAEVLNMLPCL